MAKQPNSISLVRKLFVRFVNEEASPALRRGGFIVRVNKTIMCGFDIAGDGGEPQVAGSIIPPFIDIDVSNVKVGDTLTEDDGLAAWHGQTCCAAAVTELHHALQAALARLPAEDRRFCAALAHRPVTALAAEGFGSRSALYRRLADLRHVLTVHGLGPAWDDLAAA